MKTILITGTNSYIGTNLEMILNRSPHKYKVDTVDMRNQEWKNTDFSQFDVIFHVAAIVHKKEDPNMEKAYFEINTDLALEVAKIAKESGVNQFIFMSTMAVYGEEGEIGKDVVIDINTPPNPKTFYAKSKLEAEKQLDKFSGEKFKISIVRPPIVYGDNCPGNYARLEKIALRFPVFPMIQNERSMIHIDVLSKEIERIIEGNLKGVFLPQDDEYKNTSYLIKEIAIKKGKKIYLSEVLGYIVLLLGKKNKTINKVFGNLIYKK